MPPPLDSPSTGSLPPGLVLERVLSSGERSLVLLVRRGAEPLVLRISEDEGVLAGEVALFSAVAGDGLVAPSEWGETPEGKPYVLRPFAPGVPIDEALRAASDDDAVRITASLLSALADLHDAGFVHRDVKAGNVIVDGHRARLIDLEFVDARTSVGSPRHMAPEVLLGQAYRPASDLFSVGALLAWTYAGAAPADFHQRFPMRSFWDAARLDPASLPAPLATLARACVRRHPDDRPRSARGATTLLPESRPERPGSPTLPYAAGRSEAFDGAAAAALESSSLVLVAAPANEELERAAEELHLRIVLRGARIERGADARRDAVTLRVCRDAREAVDAWRAHDPRHARGLVLLVAENARPAVRTALDSELFADERERIREMTLPTVDALTLEEHLLHVTENAAPESARDLARSLIEATSGHWTELDRCLRAAEALDVLRPTGGCYTLLAKRWPAARASDADDRARVAALSAPARDALLAAALLDEHARPLVIARVASPGGLAELREQHVIAPGVGQQGQVLVGDRRWLAAAHAATSAKELRAAHSRCADALAALGAPAAHVARHRAAASGRAAELASVLDVAEAERSAARPAVARELARAILTALGPRHSKLHDSTCVLIARVEIAQGDPQAATAVLAERYGPDFEGAPAATLLVAAEAAETAGRRTEARGLYERALDGAGERGEVLRAQIGIGYALALDGKPAASLERTDGVLLPDDPDEPAGALLNLRAGTLTECGRYAEAAKALDAALACAEACGDSTLHGRTELNRAYLERRSGHPLEALASLERARDAFDRGEHVKLRALVRNNLGVLQRDLGRLAQAAVLLEEALVLRRRIGDAHGTAVTLANLGILSLDAGRLGEALARLEHARTRMLDGGYEAELAVVECQRAMALALAGNPRAARKLLGEPAPRAARASHPILSARVAACVAFADGDGARAAGMLREALARPATDAESAERFRAARMWLALERNVADARDVLQQSLAALPSDQRRLELSWLLASDASRADLETLRAALASFDNEGRSDLVRAVATRLGRVLDRSGLREERRHVMARAESAGDALTGGLPPESRAAALRHLALLAGAGDAQGPTAGLGVEWLLAWNRWLAREQDLDGLLGATIERALEVTGARSGFLVLLDGDAVRLRVERGSLDGEGAHFSSTVVREAVAARAPVLTADAGRDARFAGSASIVALELRAVLCVPLPELDDVRGAIYLDNDRGGAVFDEFDVEAVRSLADQAAIAVENLARRKQVEELNERLRERLAHHADELASARSLLRETGVRPPVANLVGESPALRDLLDRIERFATTETPLLISGPRGLGAARVARALHERSPRADGPFLAQNLAAVPSEQIEEVLFGHAGASGRVRPGLLARAHDGTLFLDGIEELPRAQQKALLDVIDRGQVRTRGARGARKADTRVVAATNVDLIRRVRAGDFLRELYDQLASIELVLPSLAQRVEDVPHLARQALAVLNQRHGTARAMSDEVTAALARRPWAGELRELEGEVARLYHLDALEAPDQVRRPEALAATLETMPASYRLEDIERAGVVRALEATSHNKEQAARLLGISRAGLYKKMARLGLHAEKRGS